MAPVEAISPSRRLPVLCAARIVQAGGVIAYPTEGVYGLGCRPDDAAAVLRLLELKQRPIEAGLILIAANLEQLDGWIEPTAAEIRRLRAESPRPVTWIVRAGPLAPGWITGGRPTLAIRVPRHAIALGLCAAAGLPLVSTSANRRGHPPARTAIATRLRFGYELDLVLGGETGREHGPSEIRVAASGKVLRAGAR